ncbi:hypothetical protein Tco_0332289 [Tanacetum coccineum]
MCRRARDDKKGGVFGWGPMPDPQYTMTGTLSTTRCTGAPSSGSKDVQNYLDSVRGELKEELKEEMKVDLKEEMCEELKEEMRKELKEEIRAKIQDMLVDYGIKSRMALRVQNINHSAFRSMFKREKLSGNNFNDWFRQLKLVLRVEKKMFVIEQPIPPAPAADSTTNVLADWNAVYDAHNEVACLMLGSMTPELHK